MPPPECLPCAGVAAVVAASIWNAGLRAIDSASKKLHQRESSDNTQPPPQSRRRFTGPQQ